MLTEILCDKFVENGHPRGAIELHPGLNAVVGDGSEKSNSIGKSTFLMIVDFCFGGVDYVQKEKDTQTHVGEHLIKFRFDFGGKPYYFSRSTSDAEYRVVNVCNENYETLRTISLERFNVGLKKMYGLGDLDLSFRAIVGRFFRIYNRNTHNEMRPLNTVSRESDSSGIVDMLKLYRLYGDIGKFDDPFRDAVDKKNTYMNLRRFSIAPIASSKAEKEKNEKELARLRKELEELRKANALGATDEENLRAKQRNELKRERASLQRDRRKLVAKLNKVEFDQEVDPSAMAKNYKALLDFFPGADVKKIAELDQFQKKVRSLVKKEAEEANEGTRNLIAILDSRIAEVDKKLEALKDAPDVRDEIIDRNAQIVARIQELEKADSNYDEYEKAKDEFAQINADRNSAVVSRTNAMEDKINDSMKELNRLFDKDRNYAPVLKIHGFDSYQFYTPNDTGTGSRNKGLWLFDLTVLRQTGLPAFVHDSILFNSTEYERTKTILELYANETKQIFVAIDDPYANDGIFKDVVLSHTVLTLGHDGKALFGEEWNKRKQGE